MVESLHGFSASASGEGMSRRTFVAGMGAVALAGAAAAFLSACGSSATSAAPAGSAVSDAAGAGAGTAVSSALTAAATGANGKTLVAYFSGTGHTRRVAETLASSLGADLFVITPATPYTSDDLNFNNEDSRVVREYQDPSTRDLALAQNAPDNFADYDTVLVGYPIWWGDAAWAMWNFASENDFTDKTVIPFCTSYSSSLGQSGANLAQMAGTGDWQEGRRFGENAEESEVEQWAADLQA